MISKPKDNKAWELIRSEQGPNLILFQARYDWVKHPLTAATMKAVILETADWVNVVALTPEKKILTVSQYRFGIKKTTIEIPAGLIEPGEPSEHAAKRELLEETGYTTDHWEYLGEVEANPAFLDNHCHIWLALDVVKTHQTHLDETEEITLGELTLDEIRNEISAGRMRNSLTLLALSRVFDLRDDANRDRY
jgi:8-oxo-dGTP pyrophosphatase MutT (NUDIX family)